MIRCGERGWVLVSLKMSESGLIQNAARPQSLVYFSRIVFPESISQDPICGYTSTFATSAQSFWYYWLFFGIFSFFSSYKSFTLLYNPVLLVHQRKGDISYVFFLPFCWGFLNMTGRISQALTIAFLRSGKMYFSEIFKRISVISSPVASLSCISLALACSCLQCCSRFPAQLGIRWGNCICQFIDWEIDAYSHDEVAAD